MVVYLYSVLSEWANLTCIALIIKLEHCLSSARTNNVFYISESKCSLSNTRKPFLSHIC